MGLLRLPCSAQDKQIFITFSMSRKKKPKQNTQYFLKLLMKMEAYFSSRNSFFYIPLSREIINTKIQLLFDGVIAVIRQPII